MLALISVSDAAAFKKEDRVITVVDFPTSGRKAGSRGTVLEKLPNGNVTITWDKQIGNKRKEQTISPESQRKIAKINDIYIHVRVDDFLNYVGQELGLLGYDDALEVLGACKATFNADHVQVYTLLELRNLTAQSLTEIGIRGQYYGVLIAELLVSYATNDDGFLNKLLVSVYNQKKEQEILSEETRHALIVNCKKRSAAIIARKDEEAKERKEREAREWDARVKRAAERDQQRRTEQIKRQREMLAEFWFQKNQLDQQHAEYKKREKGTKADKPSTVAPLILEPAKKSNNETKHLEEVMKETQNEAEQIRLQKVVEKYGWKEDEESMKKAMAQSHQEELQRRLVKMSGGNGNQDKSNPINQVKSNPDVTVKYTPEYWTEHRERVNNSRLENLRQWEEKRKWTCPKCKSANKAAQQCKKCNAPRPVFSDGKLMGDANSAYEARKIEQQPMAIFAEDDMVNLQKIKNMAEKEVLRCPAKDRDELKAQMDRIKGLKIHREDEKEILRKKAVKMFYKFQKSGNIGTTK